MKKPKDCDFVLFDLMESIKTTIEAKPVNTLDDLVYDVANEFLRRFGGQMVYLPKQSQLLQERRLHEIKSVLADLPPRLHFLVASHYGISGMQARNILNGNA
jgi:Mor family transcriptional regulator